MMGITIGNYTFEGPFAKADALQRRSGVYAIVGRNGADWKIVDIGESGGAVATPPHLGETP